MAGERKISIFSPTEFSGVNDSKFTPDELAINIHFSVKNKNDYFMLKFGVVTENPEIELIVAELSIDMDLNALCLNSITVSPDFQRLGLGSLMLDQICNLALEKKINVLVEGATEDAWKFYEKYFRKNFDYEIGKFRRIFTVPLEKMHIRNKLASGDITLSIKELCKLSYWIEPKILIKLNK